jgi:uncharacterized membrane protein YphA (DoxX/SURF4 family)
MVGCFDEKSLYHGRLLAFAAYGAGRFSVDGLGEERSS